MFKILRVKKILVKVAFAQQLLMIFFFSVLRTLSTLPKDGHNNLSL